MLYLICSSSSFFFWTRYWVRKFLTCSSCFFQNYIVSFFIYLDIFGNNRAFFSCSSRKILSSMFFFGSKSFPTSGSFALQLKVISVSQRIFFSSICTSFKYSFFSLNFFDIDRNSAIPYFQFFISSILACFFKIPIDDFP